MQSNVITVTQLTECTVANYLHTYPYIKVDTEIAWSVQLQRYNPDFCNIFIIIVVGF